MSARVLKIVASPQTFEFCDVETDADGSIGLKTLQEAVGGFVERVCISKHRLKGLDLWLNEEGKLDGLPLNPMATNLSEVWKHGDFIVGNVLVCAFDEEGRSVGITEEQEKTLLKGLKGC